MTYQQFLFIAAVAAWTIGSLTGVASADVLFSNRGSGVVSADVFSSAINAPLLEDGQFDSSGPLDVTGVNLGYDNTGNDPVDVDVLISFWDSVNYSPSLSNAVLNENQIGTTYRFSFVANPGADETGLLAIPSGPLTFPDSDWGVIVNFVSPGTSIPMSGINHLFRDVPVTVGTSDRLFAYDYDGDDMIDSTETWTWEGDGYPAGNLFFSVEGSSVPEPAATMLLTVTGLGLLRRRRT
jgi:hypothetical protein